MRKSRLMFAISDEARANPGGVSLARSAVLLVRRRISKHWADLAKSAEKSGAVLVLDRGRPRTFLQLLYHSTREDDPAIRPLLEVVKEIWPDGHSLPAHT